jgi:hypothetical protein
MIVRRKWSLSLRDPMMKWSSALASILGMVIILMGCDDKPSVPPGFIPSAENQPAPAADARPTTQELVNGTYKRISLAPLSLTANAPQSWSVKLLADNLYFLQGPAPKGEVQIQLGERTSETAEKLDRLLRAAQRDADAHKDTTRVDIHQRGQIKVFDVQRQVTHEPPPAQPPTSGPAIPTKYIDWSVTYFVPRGSDFAAYELHFFNLSAEEFDADKDFLQKILDSVEPADAGLGVGPK